MLQMLLPNLLCLLVTSLLKLGCDEKDRRGVHGIRASRHSSYMSINRWHMAGFNHNRKSINLQTTCIGYIRYKIQDSIINITIHKSAKASMRTHASDRKASHPASVPFRPIPVSLAVSPASHNPEVV